MKIIFLCHGNICRSPMAEFILKHKLEERHIDNIEVCSRAAHTDEIGSDMYPPAKRTLDAHGVRYTRRAATLITQPDVDSADLVLVMDDENLYDIARRFGANEKTKKLLTYVGSSRDVADPWYTRDFEQTYRDIDSACDALLANEQRISTVIRDEPRTF